DRSVVVAMDDSEPTAVSISELRDVTARMLRRHVGDENADRYVRWHDAPERDQPLIVLIGGATGAGKSTVATHVAYHLDITRVISTDAIREVMRSTMTPQLAPSLHGSSFEAADAVPAVFAHGSIDRLIIGFLHQASVVAVGVRQVLQRAVVEKQDMVLEGVHLVPGTLELPSADDAFTVQVVLEIEDAEAHRSRFTDRADGEERPRQRYLAHFDEIRRIHDEMVRRAREHDIPTVRSAALDATVAEVTGLAVETVTQHQQA
ncbi:MAG: zeta toxin family protein, partial [Actinomycetota bacterium]|nr:zeta toxin family protein [Actinomycetota bacterium]